MLRAYEAYLIKKGTVKPQSVPYYLKWISDCYSFLNEPLSNRLGVEQKKQFLSEMAKRHEDWQVKQADTALLLYVFFLSKNVMPAIAEAPSISPHIEKWKPLSGSSDHHDLHPRGEEKRPGRPKPRGQTAVKE